MEYTKGDWKVGHYLVYADEPIPALICNTDIGIVSEAEKTANAHLIAGAPVMYEALKVMRKYKSDIGEYAFDVITKALAKAEGKEVDK